MTPFGHYYCFTDSWHYFNQRLEVDWRLFSLAFLQELLEVSHTCGLFSFQSSSCHTSLMGFKFTDCTYQVISWRMCCSSLLLMSLWKGLLVCFASLSCMTTNPWPTFRWDCMMLQYAVIAGLIQFALHLVQIPDFAMSKSLPHHNRASSMVYGCVI